MRGLAAWLCLGASQGFAQETPGAEVLAGQLGTAHSAWAEAELVKLGPPAGNAVALILERGTAGARGRAAFVLGEIGGVERVEVLTQAALKGPETVTDEATLALCKLNRVSEHRGHGEPMPRKNYLAPFAKLRERAIPGLIQALREPDTEVVEVGVFALWPHRDPRMIGPLVEVVDRERSWAFAHAAQLLGNFDDPRVVPALTRNVEKSMPGYGGLPALTVLLGLGERGRPGVAAACKTPAGAFAFAWSERSISYPEAFDGLVSYIEAKEDGQLDVFYPAIGATRNPKAASFLLSKLSSTDPYVVRSAIGGLGSCGDLKVVPRLIKLFENPDLADDVVWALAGLGGPEATEFLRKRLLDVDASWTQKVAAAKYLSHGEKRDDLALIRRGFSLAIIPASDLQEAGRAIANYGDDAIPLADSLLRDTRGCSAELGAIVANLVPDPSLAEAAAFAIDQGLYVEHLLPYLEKNRNAALDGAVWRRFLAEPKKSYELVEAVGLTRKKEAVPMLLELARSQNNPTSELVALGRIGGTEAETVLLERLQKQHDEPWVSEFVVRGCAELGSGVFEGDLLRLADHENYGMSEDLIRALGSCGTRKSLERLKVFVEDIYVSEEARASARGAMAAIRARG